MPHGTRFIEEHPQINEVLEKLYFKRELDQWYVEISRKNLELPREIFDIVQVSEVKVQDRFSPSIHVYVKLKDRQGEGGFSLKQEIQLKISKIVPVYEYLLFHEVKHNALMGNLGLVGPANTFELIEAEVQVNKILQQHGYIPLSHEYDLHDTVYDWGQLEGIDPVNRRLTLKDAVFVDILELCND
ncbi:hypothetical protein [Paenibacillus chitinolyticus]|uniref:hypothetical protein n=1 Tax=Paenibacillus chitinolyticus TaxID=79263 RepID=UPI0036729EFD